MPQGRRVHDGLAGFVVRKPRMKFCGGWDVGEKRTTRYAGADGGMAGTVEGNEEGVFEFLVVAVEPGQAEGLECAMKTV